MWMKTRKPAFWFSQGFAGKSAGHNHETCSDTHRDPLQLDTSVLELYINFLELYSRLAPEKLQSWPHQSRGD